MAILAVLLRSALELLQIASEVTGAASALDVTNYDCHRDG